MAARRATGPATQQRDGDLGEAILLLRQAPVVLGDGEGPPSVGRWVMAACEEFVQRLYQALLAAMALLYTLRSVCEQREPEPAPIAPALLQAASDARSKLNSPARATASKQASRPKLGPDAGSARTRTSERQRTGTTTTAASQRRSSPAKRIPPPGTALGQSRSGDRAVWPSRCKLTSSRLSTPKASASAPAPTSSRNSCPAPLSNSSAALTTAAADCKEDAGASDVTQLQQQALELFNAVVVVLSLLANLALTLASCLMKLCCARFLRLVSRQEVEATS